MSSDNAIVPFPPTLVPVRRAHESTPSGVRPDPGRTGRVLVLASAGSWYTECLWGAEDLLRREQTIKNVGHSVHCRLTHEAPVWHPLVQPLHKARSQLLLWLDNPFAVAFASMGFDAVIAVEINQLFRTIPCASRTGRIDGRPDFEPTQFERALDLVTVPVIRFWVAGGCLGDEKHASPCAYVHDYNNGRNALIRLLGTGNDADVSSEQEVSQCLANLIFWFVHEAPELLDERDIAGVLFAE